MRLLHLFVVCACYLVSLPLPATAQVTVGETSGDFNNLTQFSYLLTNIGQVSVSGFSLEVQTPIINIVAPTGWTGSTFQIGGETTVAWQASDLSNELLPGAALNNFSFTSTQTSGTVPYSVFDDNFNNFDGATQGPVPGAPVPEASTVVSLGVGLLFLGGLLLIARKRARKSAS